MKLSNEFKEKVRLAILEARERYSGSDAKFAKSIDIDSSVFSRLKKGEMDRLISDSVWLQLGRLHNVSNKETNWKIARTRVYDELEGNLTFCKNHGKAMMLVDECGIGKSECSRHIVKGMQDGFYVDCSQSKTKQRFIRAIARTVGVDDKGRYADVRDNLKYYLNNYLDKPIIVLDDAGYLDYPAFVEVQSLWNGTESNCGWYMIGDESLQTKIERGIASKKIGYKAIFSRFSSEYMHITPTGKKDKQEFYTELFGSVASVNVKEKKKVPKLVSACLSKGSTLRYLKTLIEVNA